MHGFDFFFLRSFVESAEVQPYLQNPYHLKRNQPRMLIKTILMFTLKAKQGVFYNKCVLQLLVFGVDWKFLEQPGYHSQKFPTTSENPVKELKEELESFIGQESYFHPVKLL